jgi:GGDEF domain-containing protein
MLGALPVGLSAWFGQLTSATGDAWHLLNAGFSALVFFGLATGVVAFTRRRPDLFGGLNVGWAFAVFLALTGVLMLIAPWAPPLVQTWSRGAWLVTAPVALGLMVAFLRRVQKLEEAQEVEAREASVQWKLDQTRQRLEHLQTENQSLVTQRDRLRLDADRLARERDAATEEADAARIREEESGLYTRSHFIERLREEFERCQRREALPLPLFIGLQGLETVEATKRETVTNRAAQTLQAELRLPDLACRFDRSEFLIVPCDTNAKGVTALTKRLHRQFKRDMTRLDDSTRPAGLGFAFVLMDVPVHLQQFEDYLEACNQAIPKIRQQPVDRLVRVPASFGHTS